MKPRSATFLTRTDETLRFERHPFMWESDLAEFLEAHPEVLGELIMIGRNVDTGGHGEVDLVAIDGLGRLWVVELKRVSAARRITEQTNGYGTWGEYVGMRELRDLYETYSAGGSLSEEFETRFGSPLPDRDQMQLIVAIVAFKFDEHAHCQLAWQQRRGLPIVGYEYGVLFADGVEAFEIREIEFHGH